VLLQTTKDSALKAIIINCPYTEVQIIWHKITKAAEELTTVEIKANAILQYITSVKFDDGKW